MSISMKTSRIQFCAPFFFYTILFLVSSLHDISPFQTPSTRSTGQTSNFFQIPVPSLLHRVSISLLLSQIACIFANRLLLCSWR
jgi:hypothetical protein